MKSNRFLALAVRNFWTATLCLCCLVGCSVASAGEVGPDAFGVLSKIQTFDDLGFALQNQGPVTIGDDTYSTTFGLFRYRNDWGDLMGRTGGGIGNNLEGEYLQIDLATPALRAGLYTGKFVRYGEALVSFYDTNLDLLGEIPTSMEPGTNQFAGWQADVGRIARIRVTDNYSADFEIVAIDDFIQEVPEPSSWAIVLILVGLTQSGRPWNTNRKRPIVA